EIIDGELTPSIETPEVGFFSRDELPPISTARVTEEQIQQFFDYLESIPEATKFD
ncbi:TPA: ADP-ribose pyrophosphatase, partial [Acinetobacter baumannii]